MKPALTVAIWPLLRLHVSSDVDSIKKKFSLCTISREAVLNWETVLLYLKIFHNNFPDDNL